MLNLAPGTYTLTVRSIVDNTCSTAAASTVTIDAIPSAPAAAVASVTVQPTCAVPTGTIVISSPTGATLEYSIDGTNFQSGLTFANLLPGDYTVTVRSTTDNTCTSTRRIVDSKCSTWCTGCTCSECYDTANVCGTDRNYRCEFILRERP
ncbi:MAG: hypothetical protein U5K51_04610 [Flavobacteriaceae bacterium]|nr:hypothetical protein [Flavobacteriaceae bacterium]